MSDADIIGGICRFLEAGESMVLATLVGRQGSVARHAGAKMIISHDGSIFGTIGGSLIEAAAIRESQDLLFAAKSKILSYDLTGTDTTAPGMICGGKAELLLDHIPATEDNKEFFRCWYEGIRRGDDFYFLTHLKDTDDNVEILGHLILYPDGRIIGDTLLTEADRNSLKEELHKIFSTSVIPIGDTRVVIDPIRKMKTLYCFGAGHVAVPTANIAALVGFRVVVVDDRAEFANPERFPAAHKIHVIENFNRALEGLEVDSNSFIVILTREHQYDRIVLEQALKTTAGYIGMISSRHKRAAIYEALMNKGISREKLEQVHSPVGIDIGGETPEEIAVSIVAELISERSKQSA